MLAGTEDTHRRANPSQEEKNVLLFRQCQRLGLSLQQDLSEGKDSHSSSRKQGGVTQCDRQEDCVGKRGPALWRE